MLKVNSTVSTFLIAGTIAAGMMSSVNWTGDPRLGRGLQFVFDLPAHAQEKVTEAPDANWAASATGRVEPVSGTVEISSQASGRIETMYVSTGDAAKKGDVLFRLDDEDAYNRVRAAQAEVEVRKLERQEDSATGARLERQNAQDAAAEAERKLFAAWLSFDEAVQDNDVGSGSNADVDAARDAVTKAQVEVRKTRRDLQRVERNQEDAPLPTRLETALEIARAELSMAERAFQRTRVRAPFDGTVLKTMARVGETAAASPQRPLLTFGDTSTLRVRAELEERDVSDVRVGQRIVVRVDAFPDQDFGGKVTSIASALGSPRIATRGPRRPNDVDVLEVEAELDGTPPLLTGMRVDVFFQPDEKKTSQSSATGTDAPVAN